MLDPSLFLLDFWKKMMLARVGHSGSSKSVLTLCLCVLYVLVEGREDDHGFIGAPG
jgi:hypothetical protein